MYFMCQTPYVTRCSINDQSTQGHMNFL